MTLADVFARIVPPDRGVRFTAYDGSSSGPIDSAFALDLRSPRGVSYILHEPNQLGLARAYVSGDLEIVGDVHGTMSRLYPLPPVALSIRDKAALAAKYAPLLLKNPPPPPQERILEGDRHSKNRDAQAISHHYDVSNAFYNWVLGPSMTYTCALFADEQTTLEQAQYAKYDLVCRKLGLRPGMRLLDVGCGWGGMVQHAVRHYGVTAIGVTLSEQQATWGQARIIAEGLSDRSQIRFCDYRDVKEADFDAVSSIGLTEHIGRQNYPAYFRFLFDKLKPEGRLLNHTITRPNDVEPTHYTNSFTNRYVFPDGELSGPGHIMSVMNDAGFEIRHSENLREHYARTLQIWGENLEQHWRECIGEAGEGTARVWRLYMAVSRMGFDLNTIQLHQFLGVKLGDAGHAGLGYNPDVGR